MFRILQIHRWLSLVLGLPVALVAISGLPLALWEETDAIAAPAFYPAGATLADGAIDRAILAVTTRHSDMSRDFIYFPRASAVMHVGGTLPSGEQIEVAVNGAGQRIRSVSWPDRRLQPGRCDRAVSSSPAPGTARRRGRTSGPSCCRPVRRRLPSNRR